MKGNVLTFRNPEDKTSCIVLNLLKTENQRSGAAREERVAVVKAKMLAISSDTHQLGPTLYLKAPLYNIIIILLNHNHGN